MSQKVTENGSTPDYLVLPEISEQQQRAIELLLGGQTQTAVAAELQVARETISRWNLQPDFTAALNAARLAQWEHHQAAMTALADTAAQGLREMLESKTHATRLQALKIFFQYHAAEKPTGQINVAQVESNLRKLHKPQIEWDTFG